MLCRISIRFILINLIFYTDSQKSERQWKRQNYLERQRLPQIIEVELELDNCVSS